jgi:hypothetical protein
VGDAPHDGFALVAGRERELEASGEVLELLRQRSSWLTSTSVRATRS